MTTLRKLTLSIDQTVIERARRYSERHGTSISRLVTNYLAQLEDEKRATKRDSATVRRLRGVLPPEAHIEEYHEHVERKYRR